MERTIYLYALTEHARPKYRRGDLVEVRCGDDLLVEGLHYVRQIDCVYVGTTEPEKVSIRVIKEYVDPVPFAKLLWRGRS